MENLKFQQIINEINKYTQNVVFQVVFNQKLNKELLVCFTTSSKSSIMVFDENSNINEIAKISYAIRGNNVVVSSIEVNSDYQQNGIAKMLFNIALAHADFQLANNAFGDVDPINDIRGIDKDNFEKHKETLIEIYKKLGCSYCEETNRFNISWEHGERIELLTEQEQQVFNSVVAYINGDTIQP